MISISPDLLAGISSNKLDSVVLITLGFPSHAGGTLYITDSPFDISHGGFLYTSSDNLIGVAPPQTQNSVDRDVYTLQFTDTDNAMRNRFRASQTGVPLSVKILFYTGVDDELTTDALDVYTGISGAVKWEDGGNSAVLTVGFTGQLAQLESAKVLWTTDASQHTIDSSDTAFKYVSDTTNNKALRWGRD